MSRGTAHLRRLLCHAPACTLPAPATSSVSRDAGYVASLRAACVQPSLWQAVHDHHLQYPKPARPFLRHTHSQDIVIHGLLMHKHQFNPAAGPLLLLTHFHTHDLHMQEHGKHSAATHAGHVRASDAECKRLLKLVDEEDLKKRLLNSTGQDPVRYADFIELCKDRGVASTDAEADAIVKRLDNAGVILVLRNVVFLHPAKVADIIASALPMSLTGEDDPRKVELRKLEKEKEEIDKTAQKQVKRMLWMAFGALSLQSLLFFRLTFWDLSWDVMEPITFFVTSGVVLAGVLFFIFTHREPSYQDLMHTLFSLKQRKLMKKYKFDANRLKHLQMMHYTLPLSPSHD